MKIKLSILFTLVLLCLISSSHALTAKGEHDQAYYHYMMGAMKENQRDYTGAIAEYREALKYDPEASDIFARLASLYAQTDRLDEAVQDATKAIQSNPDNEEAHRMLGQVFMQKLYTGDGSPENVGKATKEFEEVLRIDPDDDNAMLTLAQLYMQGKQPEKAADVLSKYVGSNPDSPSAIMSLASAYQQMNQPKKALEYMMKYLDANPDNIYVLQQAADMQLKAGDAKKALDLQKHAYEIEPDNQGIIRGYVDLLLRNHQPAEVVKIVQPLVKDDPDDVEWTTLLARGLSGTGESDRAESLMKDLIAKHPAFDTRLALVQIYEDSKKFDDANGLLRVMLADLETDMSMKDSDKITSRAVIYSHLGYSTQQKKEYEKAIEYYQKARQYVPDTDTNRLDFYIALNYRNLKNWDKAIETSNNIVQKDPNDTDTWELLSLIYEEKGDHDNSDRVLKHLIDTHPDTSTYKVLKAERMQQRQKYEDSIEYLKELVPQFPKDTQVLFLLGAGLERLKRYDESEEYFKQSLALDPDDPNTLNYLGYMLVDRGVRLEEGLGYIKRALDEDKDNGAFLDSLGWAYFKLNQLDLAEDNLRQAEQKLDDNPVVHDHLGDLYFKQGKFRDALDHWKQALQLKNNEIDPDLIQKKIDDTSKRLK